MQLYGSFTSPFVRHCCIALLESQLDCEFIETDAVASAKLSPTKRVPYLMDGKTCLSDSMSIVKYLRAKSGSAYLSDVMDLELYCMANSALDASANVFFMKRFDDIDTVKSSYLTRQSDRVKSILVELNELELSEKAPYSDSELRLACFLDWGNYRKRISLDGLSKLQTFLDNIQAYPPFKATKPPAEA